MKDIRFDNIPAVNVEALDASLRTALGGEALGISYDGQTLTLHLSDQAAPNRVGQARRLAQEHDPSQLTPRQQAEIQRRAKLEQSRRDISADLDVSVYAGKDALLEQLAKRVAWLEQEVIALRKG